jgi:hypothetical protein
MNLGAHACDQSSGRVDAAASPGEGECPTQSELAMHIVWHEVAKQNLPTYLIAGRSDNVSEPHRHTVEEVPMARGNTRIPDRGVAAGRFSNDTVGTLILFTANTANDLSLRYAINRELRRLNVEVWRTMRRHHDGGVLAVADVITRYDPRFAFVVADQRRPITNHGPQTQQLSALWLQNGVYAQPAHAIGVFERRNRGGTLRPDGGRYSYNDYKYFWAVWDHATPRYIARPTVIADSISP